MDRGQWIRHCKDGAWSRKFESKALRSSSGTLVLIASILQQIPANYFSLDTEVPSFTLATPSCMHSPNSRLPSLPRRQHDTQYPCFRDRALPINAIA